MGKGWAKTAVALALAIESMLAKIQYVLDELIATMPQGCAEVTVKRDERASTIEIHPRHAAAAPICVIVPSGAKGDVTVIAGKGTFFEIPPEGRRYTALPLPEEVAALCSAVITGGLTENVVSADSEVIEGQGTIQMGDPVTVRWKQLTLKHFTKKHKESLTYDPYYC